MTSGTGAPARGAVGGRLDAFVEDWWGTRRVELAAEINEVQQTIASLVRIEQHHRDTLAGGQTTRRGFGAIGSSALDLDRLMSSLRGSYESRPAQRERFERLTSLAGSLEALVVGGVDALPEPRVVELSAGVDAVLGAWEEHAAAAVKIHQLLRTARLESKGRYDSAVHDPFFEHFDWRELDNHEARLTPPLLVRVAGGAEESESIGAVLSLLSAGRPVKIVITRTDVGIGVHGTGREMALGGALDLSTLFLAFRGACFVQSTVTSEALGDMVGGALASARPAVISILDTGEQSRDRMAVESRAFPLVSYDPEAASDFVSCLDLSANPELQGRWCRLPIDHQGPDGLEQTDRCVTFADLASTDDALRAQFTTLAEDAPRPVALDDYLDLGHDARRAATPFILATDDETRLVRLVPSRPIVARTADRLHLWHTLQELAGIENPFVRAAESRVAERLETEHRTAIEAQRHKLEERREEHAREAVAAALRTVAGHLTAVGGGEALRAGVAGINSGVSVVTAAGDSRISDAAPGTAAPSGSPDSVGATSSNATDPGSSSPSADTAPGGDEEAWVDERLCTSCDECIAVNRTIFAYDGSKKAFVKDPRGGPFRDIVAAAEKCSSGAIHTGTPLDPSEPDLEKWVVRSAPFA